jgi:hypothetical protein
MELALLLHGYSALIGAIDVEKIDSFEARIMAGRKKDRELGLLAEAQIRVVSNGLHPEGVNRGRER